MTSTTRSTIGRREVLRGAALGGAVLMTGAQGACSSGGPDGSAAPSASKAVTVPRASPLISATTARNDRSRVLVVYYSRPGENYSYGGRVDLSVGNTEVLANLISSRLTELRVRYDVHRLEAADRYPDDYDSTVARNVREQDADSRPALANPVTSLDGYEVVLVGSPIWNVRPPMLMRTFTEDHDFTGRSVHPFVTYAVSGPGNTERDYAEACRGAALGAGLAVRGETVKDDGPGAVTEWLDAMALPGRPS